MSWLAALDASTPTAIVAVGDGERLVTRAAASSARAEMLLPLLDEALRELGLAPAALDAIVCGVGPGSFTGVRIALATAKGLAWSLGRPLIPCSSLAALALGAAEAGAPVGTPVLAVLDAYRGEVYGGLYELCARAVGGIGVRPLAPDAVVPPGELAGIAARAAGGVWVVGAGAAKYPEAAAAAGRLVLEAPAAPSPRALAVVGADAFAADPAGALATAVPAYLRASEAERNLTEPLPPPAPPRG